MNLTKCRTENHTKYEDNNTPQTEQRQRNTRTRKHQQHNKINPQTNKRDDLSIRQKGTNYTNYIAVQPKIYR